MSQPQKNHKRLVETAFNSGRQVSAASVHLHQVVADYFAISASDSRYASMVREKGPMLAGDLAKVSGLSPGAVTGLIDRLEKARMVRRVANPGDRRQVLVEASSEHLPELQQLFSGLSARAHHYLASYSDQELELITRFNTESARLIRSETEKLRSDI